eukprot:1176797-Prorocentrum_minimum.AAC.6
MASMLAPATSGSKPVHREKEPLLVLVGSAGPPPSDGSSGGPVGRSDGSNGSTSCAGGSGAGTVSARGSSTSS